MKGMETAALVFQIAFRNLWLYRFRTIVIAFILGSGAFLAIVGLSLLTDVESSMRSSITESIAGHLQVYSAKAKDELALFGNAFMGRAELDSISDYSAVQKLVLQNSNVDAFIPMGLDMAMLGRGNEMDDSIDALRSALKLGDAELIKDRKDQIGFLLQQLQLELAEQEKIVTNKSELETKKKNLELALAPEFLAQLKADDEKKIQFLETQIAPISGEKLPIYLFYLGTDIGAHRKNFTKIHIEEGEALPEGRRGIVLSKTVRETQLKRRVAKLFDLIHKSKTKANGAIKGDPENSRNAADLVRQGGQIISDLDRNESVKLSQALNDSGFKAAEADRDIISKLKTQLKLFLTVDDTNFSDRYTWFYENIAPLIRLYELSPGEKITLRSYTRSGYVKSVSLKIYGVYSVAGMEDSELAGAANIMDLVSFRELLGQMNDASRKELDGMREQSGIKEVNASDAESALFGATATIEAQSLSQNSPTAVAPEVISVKPVLSDVFELPEVQKGLILNGALKLKDFSKLKQTKKELEVLFKANNLDLKIVDWQEASGIVGQFVNIVRGVLIFALFVIFVVALVIINNSIIIGTLNRTREIGTMRAIGAQKRLVLNLFLAETAVTGLLGAVVGALFAFGFLSVLNRLGIPAGNDILAFLFSGPRLFPKIHLSVLIMAPIVVTLIATVTSFYAARHAAQINPAEAMQEKE